MAATSIFFHGHLYRTPGGDPVMCSMCWTMLDDNSLKWHDWTPEGDDMGKERDDKHQARVDQQANEGRAVARAAVIEFIKTQLFKFKDAPEAIGEGARKGFEDALKLFEQTDPLQIWEADCRKGHKQWGNKTARLCHAFLDGEKLERCVAADSVAGLVLVLREDEKGRVCHHKDGVLTDVVTGKVELRHVDD